MGKHRLRMRGSYHHVTVIYPSRYYRAVRYSFTQCTINCMTLNIQPDEYLANKAALPAIATWIADSTPCDLIVATPEAPVGF